MERRPARQSRNPTFADEIDEERDASSSVGESFVIARRLRGSKRSKLATAELFYEIDIGNESSFQENNAWLPDCDATSSEDSPCDSFVANIRKSNDKRRQLGRRKEAAIQWKQEIYHHVDRVLQYRMLFTIPKPLTSQDNSMCCFPSCQNVVQWVCDTCRDFGVNSTFCEEHVGQHRPLAHSITNIMEEVFVHVNRRSITCSCAATSVASCSIRLHRLGAMEDVDVKTCESCAVVDVLIENGFFPSSTKMPSTQFLYFYS